MTLIHDRVPGKICQTGKIETTAKQHHILRTDIPDIVPTVHDLDTVSKATVKSSRQRADTWLPVGDHCVHLPLQSPCYDISGRQTKHMALNHSRQEKPVICPALLSPITFTKTISWRQVCSSLSHLHLVHFFSEADGPPPV